MVNWREVVRSILPFATVSLSNQRPLVTNSDVKDSHAYARLSLSENIYDFKSRQLGPAGTCERRCEVHSKVIKELSMIIKSLKRVRFLVLVRVTIPEHLLSMQLADSFLY